MRFSAKYVVMTKWQIWTWAVLGLFNILFGIHAFWGRKSFSGAFYVSQGVFFLSFPLFSCITPIFIYSEMNADCLRLHKFWKEKEIAWNEVRSVNRFGFTDSLTISFGHQIDDYGRITVTPENRDQYISMLRQYAPLAEFDV